ncbi:uncharacterized protein LOC132731681 isoform X2 [Ruditapes philippinarum]|uniref:uncharacterized protein LOC132731681 isoform X2 n=1 Tax=Ruditapes philippinarum TaxID=129788 RepID=UPI00295AF7D3|nr:uncharacterized protein LOC132731681 isoform X2 [Ruditapes philippinarum]
MHFVVVKKTDSKMKVTTKVCCEVVSLLILSLTLLSACLAAPLDTYYQTDDSELINPQRLQLLKELKDMIEIEERNKQEEMGKPFVPTNDATGLMRVMPQKRFRPFRTQTRGGGVALCLWKVCPAAPWLTSRS